MNKQSRRLFLKNASIISSMAISINHAFGQKETRPTTYTIDSIAFFNQVPNKQYKLTQLQDSELIKLFELSLQKWQNTGYDTIVNSYHVCQNSRLVLFPLVMSHSQIGVLDTAILCFGKNKDDKWQQLRSISGFELEALHIAKKGLLKNNPMIDLTAYLLPAVKDNNNLNHLFHTEKGDVYISTKLSPAKTMTTIRIREHSDIIFQTEIVSQHLLVQKS